MRIIMIFAFCLFVLFSCLESDGSSGSGDGDGNTESCGIENCHGTDITCGSNVATVCTEIYMQGDGCRQYASCEIVDGECTLVKEDEFDTCVSCVDDCYDGVDGSEGLACESDCWSN
ncbi:MAG: hypothetical protein ABIA04_15580 [Pseudomonadota bacterium]